MHILRCLPPINFVNLILKNLNICLLTYTTCYPGIICKKGCIGDFFIEVKVNFIYHQEEDKGSKDCSLGDPTDDIKRLAKSFPILTLWEQFLRKEMIHLAMLPVIFATRSFYGPAHDPLYQMPTEI